MKDRTTIAGTGVSARLTVIGWGTMTILASAALSACTASTPSAGEGQSSVSPAVTVSPTPTTSPSGTASPSPSPDPSATPSVTPGQSASPLPSAAPATGGGGTAGFQDPLLLALGGAAVLAGAGSIAYRRKIIKAR